MSTTPALTVVTPAYNDAPFLTDCVESVVRAADTAALSVTHIVIDDASSDDTPAVLARLQRVHGIVTDRLPVNAGCSAALNAACQRATTEWLLVLASDDMVTRRAFHEWRRTVQQYPTANVIYSDLELCGARSGFYRPPPFRRTLLHERSIIPGSSFLKRALWEVVGGFDEALPSAQDWDLWVRADLAIGLTPARARTPLVRYRYHDTPRLHDASVRNIETIRTHIRRVCEAAAAGAPA